jgi:hypothetical protein
MGWPARYGAIVAGAVQASETGDFVVENPSLRKFHNRFRMEPFPVFDTENGHA